MMKILGYLTGALVIAGATHALADGMPPADPSHWRGAFVEFEGGGGHIADYDMRFPPPYQRTSGNNYVYGVSLGYLMNFNGLVAGVSAGYRYQPIEFEGIDKILGYSIRADELLHSGLRLGYAAGPVLATVNASLLYATSNIPMEDYGVGLGVSLDYMITNGLYAGVSYDHQFYRDFAGAPLDIDVDSVVFRLGYLF